MRRAIIGTLAKMLGVQVRFRSNAAPHHLDVAKEFAVHLGFPNSDAENLRDLILHKLANYQRVHVDMSGCRGGVSAAFLQRAFGGLVNGRYSASEIFDRLVVTSYEPTDIVIIGHYIEPMWDAEDIQVPILTVLPFEKYSSDW